MTAIDFYGLHRRLYEMNAISTKAIRAHYDRLSIFYWWLWGEHIHHGFWQNGESPREAQIRLIAELARRSAIPRGAKVLDVGCGLGGSALWLARELGCSVLGITISPVQKRIAERRARSFGLSDRVRFSVKDANHLNFGAESFDVIWNVECSEHLTDKASFIQSCGRLLRRGGVLALCTLLAAESCSPSANPELVARICSGMLFPGLGTLGDYKSWMSESGFEQINADDLTPQVEKTWDVCQGVLRRPVVRLFLRLMGAQTRKFAKFDAIDRAYREGAMRYGMFSARKL